MRTSVNNRQTSIESAEYNKYEVDIKTCKLNISDMVMPDTIIGYHHKDGQPVRAGLYGYIATAFFNPMHDSLMIVALALNDRRHQTDTRNG